MTPANFNMATAYDTFPIPSSFEGGSPSVADPGFVTVDKKGNAQWFANIVEARQNAGTTKAIYAAMDLNAYYRQDAQEAHINPKTGKETFSGPVPPAK